MSEHHTTAAFTLDARATRFKWVYDPDATFEECNGEPRPLTRAEYQKNPYMERGANSKGRYRKVSYARYLSYQGNPERHVYLGLIQQEQCPCCGSWIDVGSLWGIDFMDDSADWLAILPYVDRWIAADVARQLPEYAGQLCREGVKG